MSDSTKDPRDENDVLPDSPTSTSADDFDAEAAAARDYHFVALHERAVQHLIG